MRQYECLCGCGSPWSQPLPCAASCSTNCAAGACVVPKRVHAPVQLNADLLHQLEACTQSCVLAACTDCFTPFQHPMRTVTYSHVKCSKLLTRALVLAGMESRFNSASCHSQSLVFLPHAFGTWKNLLQSIPTFVSRPMSHCRAP